MLWLSDGNSLAVGSKYKFATGYDVTLFTLPGNSTCGKAQLETPAAGQQEGWLAEA